MIDQKYVLHYRLDKVDRIIHVGGAWDRFALENGAESLAGTSVIGRSLYDFIQGDISRMFVRTVVDGVRTLQRPRTLPYRCDSPGMRRFMEMTVTNEAGGELLLEHRQLRTEDSARKISFSSRLQAMQNMIVRCTNCNAIKLKGVWGEPEASPPEEAPAQAALAYGVCPRCLKHLQRK